MILKVSTWLAVAIAGGALLAGCGSSSKPSTSTGQSTLEQSAVGQQAVASCKRSVQAQKTLSATDKEKLDKICDKAASGNPATMQQVAHEACVELVNDSHLPAGVSKQEALAICSTVKAK